jgi:hypothetical protein
MVGTDPAQNLCAARAERINAEIELFKFRQAMGMPIEKPKVSEKVSRILNWGHGFQEDPENDIQALLDPVLAAAIIRPQEYSLRNLQKDRCREWARYCGMIQTLTRIGKWNPQDFAESLKVADTLGKNLLELVEKPEDKIKCYEFRIGALKEFEKFISLRVEVGTEPSQNLKLARASGPGVTHRCRDRSAQVPDDAADDCEALAARTPVSVCSGATLSIDWTPWPQWYRFTFQVPGDRPMSRL